jgi:hypothetical protein
VTEDSKRHRDNNTSLVHALQRQVAGQSERLVEVNDSLRGFEQYVDKVLPRMLDTSLSAKLRGLCSTKE